MILFFSLGAGVGRAQVVASALPRVGWLGSASPIDLDRFPERSNPGWLEVSLPSYLPIVGGAIGLVAWDADGVAATSVLFDGRRPPDRPGVWTIDPPEDGREGSPGYLRFALADAAQGPLAITVRLAFQGPARPLRIELHWWAIDTPTGSDTTEVEGIHDVTRGSPLGSQELPAVTVLGGPASISRGVFVQAISPRTPIAGGGLRLLGAGLDGVESLALCDRAGREWLLDKAAGALARRYRIPPGITGPFALLLNGARASGCGVRVLAAVQEPTSLVDPVWYPADGDVLIVAADGLYVALGPLKDDLIGRGYRPSATSIGRILARYGPASGDEAIRCAISDACSAFRSHPLALLLVGTASEDVPENDGLPTVHVEYEHEFTGYYDSTYAEDAAFGDISQSPDQEMELLVGRIPARTPSELFSYVAKLQIYRQQIPRSRVLLSVGDASINRDNSDRRRAAASLMETLSEGGVLSANVQYATSYEPLSDVTNRQRALSDLQGALAEGVGVLDLFGNNTRPTNIVHLFESPPGPQLPWLLPGAMPTQARFPIALFHTCLNGAFDEDAHFTGYDSPAETWVRDPTHGAVACLAQSHITTFFDDWEMADRIYRRLARRDGALLGAIQAGARWDLLSQSTRGVRSLNAVRMTNLLGDPLLEPRLAIVQKRLEGSFESSGSWPMQNRLCLERGWTTAEFDSTCSSARVVYGGLQSLGCGGGRFVGTVYPIRGSRMLRVEGLHSSGAGRRAAAWRLFRCDLIVEKGSLLSYWVRQEEDPRGMGRLCIDAVTESGRIMSRDLLDTSGHRADPRCVRYPLGQWRRVTVRLDPWQGERIREVFVRYEDHVRPGGPTPPMEQRKETVGDEDRDAALEEPPLPGGTFAGFIDDVRIETGFLGPLLDGGFTVDDDGDLHPDHWHAEWRREGPSEPTKAVAVQDDGPPGLWLEPTQDSSGSASQLLGPFDDSSAPHLLRFESWGNPGALLEIALHNPLTGEEVARELVGPLAPAWQDGDALFPAGCGSSAVLTLRPLSGTVGLRHLRIESAQTSNLPRELEGLHAGTPVRIGPNPTGGELRISWSGSPDRPRQIDLLDVHGRRVSSWRPLEGEPGRFESVWILRDDQGRRLPAGAYFVRATGSWGTTTRTIQLVR